MFKIEKKDNQIIVIDKQTNETLIAFSEDQKILIVDKLKLANVLYVELGFVLYNTHLNPDNGRVIFVLIKEK
jgi:hypothetical protein